MAKVWQHLLNFNHDCCGEIIKRDDNIDFYQNETESQGDLAFMLNFTLFLFILLFLSNQFQIVDISNLIYVCSSSFLSTIHSIARNKCGIILYVRKSWNLSEKCTRWEDWKTQQNLSFNTHIRSIGLSLSEHCKHNRLLFFITSLFLWN